eukprot:5915706-Prymnesium_polylepis.1
MGDCEREPCLCGGAAAHAVRRGRRADVCREGKDNSHGRAQVVSRGRAHQVILLRSSVTRTVCPGVDSITIMIKQCTRPTEPYATRTSAAP